MALFGTKKADKKTERSEAKVAKRVEARAIRPLEGREREVIRALWFSEKALIGPERGVYVFAVSKQSTSAEIAGAIKAVYGVAPRAVRIVNTPGKRKAF